MPEIDETGVLTFGSLTRRPLEQRFGDIYNVKDYNVKGDSGESGTTGTDDAPAIQAIVNGIMAGSRVGTLFFPAGHYRIGSPINCPNDNNHTICFKGVGGSASHLVGNVAGYILDRNLPNATQSMDVFEHLRITNYHPAETSGCIRWGAAVGCHVIYCTLEGSRGFYSSEGLFGFSMNNCELGVIGHTGATIGCHISVGGPSFISGCDFIGFDRGVYFALGGGTIVSCRFEMNTTGIWDACGILAMGIGMEANLTHIYCGGNFSQFICCGGLADAFGPLFYKIKTGTATVGTNVIHFTDVDDLVVGLSLMDGTGVCSSSVFIPNDYMITHINADGANTVRLNKNVLASSAPGSGIKRTGGVTTNGSPIVSMTDASGLAVGMCIDDQEGKLWPVNVGDDEYHISALGPGANQVTLDKNARGDTTGNIFYFGSSFHITQLSIDGIRMRNFPVNVQLRGCNFVGDYSGSPYHIEGDGEFTMHNCYGSNTQAPTRILTVDNHTPGSRIRTRDCNFDYAGLFANLPSDAAWGGDIYQVHRRPRRGERCFISDGGSQTIGATVSTGSGVNWMEVMWNGTAWIRVG